MMTSFHWNVFLLLTIWVVIPPVTGGFFLQRASNSGFDVFFDVNLNGWAKSWVQVIWDAIVAIVTSL